MGEVARHAVLIAIRIDPITPKVRDAARAEVIGMIADLEANHITLYKIALMCHRQFNTVKNWKTSGRIEALDWKMLKSLHEHYVSHAKA